MKIYQIEEDQENIILAIRRKELRKMVPLADSTIFEMERRGEFPRRFAIGPRCVVWDFNEVQEWLKQHRSHRMNKRNPLRPLQERKSPLRSS
jgi:prophage regulatory protein